MKINFLLPGVGISGGTRVVFEYANRLSERGHDVTILYPIIPPCMEEKWLAPRARLDQVLEFVRRLSTSKGVDWFNLSVPIERIPSLAPTLINSLEGSIPDADITIATAWQTAYAVDALGKSKGEKVYFVQHYEIWNTWNSDEAWTRVSSITDDPSEYPIEMYEITPPTEKQRKEKQLVDRSYKLSLSKVTISSWLSELLQTKFDENVVDVIPNSVNHSIFYPNSNTDSEQLSLLLPYRNASWKGQREAKRLIDEISSHSIQIHTYGSGDKSDLPQAVTHHSNISDEELRVLYADADIFALTAWVEGFGLPPLEAMACKCAVVTTDVGAVSDYAENRVTASIVPPRNSSALIEAVRELIDDNKLRERLQERGFECAKEYTWDDATIQFENTLQRIVNSAPHEEG